LANWERDECLKYASNHRDPHIEDLRRVFVSQTRLNVKADGLTAEIAGNRASGTAGTSVANKIVMISALKYAMIRSYMAGKVTFYCDGDDTLIFVAPDALQYEASWLRRLSCLGLDVVVENRATTVEDIIFCRSKPVRFGDRAAMLIKRPADAFKTMCAVVRHFKGDAVVDYFATMRDGYSRLWAGVPVMAHLADVFGTEGNVNHKLRDSDDNYRFREGTTTSAPITAEARADFHRVFGISVQSQLEVESLCASVGELVPGQLREFVRARKTSPWYTY